MIFYVTTRIPESLKRLIGRLMRHGYQPPEEEKPEPEPEKNPYRVAVHYDSADFGKDAAGTACAYIEGCMGKIWPTECVVGHEVPEEVAKDENYLPEYRDWTRGDGYVGPSVDAHQHLLVASTSGSHGWEGYSRVGNSDDLAELDPEYQKFGRGWEHHVVSVVLHEIAHGLSVGDETRIHHGDGTKIQGCRTPMRSGYGDSCYAHVYSDKVSEEIRKYMEEVVGYKDA